MKKILFYSSLVLLFHHSCSANPNEIVVSRKLDRIEQLFINSKFELLYSKHELGPVISTFIPQYIADPGEPYNEACEATADLPRARIALAGKSDKMAFVAYEGSYGIGSYSKLLIFG